MKITSYEILTDKRISPLTLAVVADLHAKPARNVIKALEKIKPDAIVSPGDMFECFVPENDKKNKNGFDFFEHAARIAPVYYCFGNHEIEGQSDTSNPDISGYKSIPPHILDRLSDIGVHTVFDSFELYDQSIAICGLLSGQHRTSGLPNLNLIKEFEQLDAYKILLCHHPEYYEAYLSERDVDMIISGHAHGGQWRIFGRGIYAPGQGLFPKYTSGMHDGKLIISRGCSNSTRPIPVPRFFNPCEILKIEIKSKSSKN